MDFQSCQIKPCNKPPGDVDDDDDDFDKNGDDDFDKYHDDDGDDDSAILIVLCSIPYSLPLDCNYFSFHKFQS